MGSVSVSSSPESAVVRPVLARAVERAREALVELHEGGVGKHLGVTAEDDCSATHRFAADLPGYYGWQWAVVVAAAPESDHVTVSELALLPGPDALVAPEWLPWDQRVRPGDLSPGDLLAPAPNDPRLVPGYVETGDPEIDDVAFEVGLGRKQVMSREGREECAARWHDGDFGPDSDMAKAAPSTCALCGFYLPLAGSLHAAFGVCGNEMAADGHIVTATYGCGAHSDTTLPTGAGTPRYDAYDDAAVEVVEMPEAPQPESDPAPQPESETAEPEPEPETVIETGAQPETDAPTDPEPPLDQASDS
ncbi:MAG: DUF3027 domain-containing protein [Nocardiaceae bacterium]|nr:DUF3027 domain-containing protein [Nocardiaceae bacterium]